MKLYFDTSDNNKVTLKLDEEYFEYPVKRPSSQNLLNLIEELLIKKGKTIQEVTTIEANTGPGSFTGLKVGMAVGNALAWSLGVPINEHECVMPNYVKEDK